MVDEEVVLNNLEMLGCLGGFSVGDEAELMVVDDEIIEEDFGDVEFKE